MRSSKKININQINTGSLATTGSNNFSGNQIITGSMIATQGFTGSLQGNASSASTASYANIPSILGYIPENIFNKNTGSLTNNTSSYTSNFTVSQSLDLKLNKTGGILEGLLTFPNGMLGLRNVDNTFTSFFTNTNTASRTYTLQDKSGTIAHLDDIVIPMQNFNFFQQYRYVATVANNWHSIGNIHGGDYQTVYNVNSGQSNKNLVLTNSGTFVYRAPTKCKIKNIDVQLTGQDNDGFLILKSSNNQGLNRVEVYAKEIGQVIAVPILGNDTIINEGDYLHIYFTRNISNQGFGTLNITFQPVV